MLRRWCIPLAGLAVVVGSLAAAGPATASAAATPSVHHGTVSSHLPLLRHPMIRAGHGTQPLIRGGVHNASTTSSNWSGYAASGGTYTSVSASWTQPSVTCSGSKAQYSAFWVGLDGYSSQSVEQDGTEADCSGGSPVYDAWYEMYPSAPVNFPNTVRPGDHMSASVTYNGGSSYTLKISDSTEGWNQSTNQSLSGAPNSSAEVIVEAPCCTVLGGPLQLAHFSPTSFTSSTVDGSAIGNFNPTEITMVGNNGDKDSISALSGGTNFTATWLASK